MLDISARSLAKQSQGALIQPLMSRLRVCPASRVILVKARSSDVHGHMYPALLFAFVSERLVQKWCRISFVYIFRVISV